MAYWKQNMKTSGNAGLNTYVEDKGAQVIFVPTCGTCIVVRAVQDSSRLCLHDFPLSGCLQ